MMFSKRLVFPEGRNVLQRASRGPKSMILEAAPRGNNAESTSDTVVLQCAEPHVSDSTTTESTVHQTPAVVARTLQQAVAPRRQNPWVPSPCGHCGLWAPQEPQVQLREHPRCCREYLTFLWQLGRSLFGLNNNGSV